MAKVLLLLVALTLVIAQNGPLSNQDIIARAKALELKTRYTAPPGEPLMHHAAGYAKVICSAVFVSGLDPEFAAENLGYFVAPYAERKQLRKPVVDRSAKTVHVDLPDGRRRSARFTGSQGCITLHPGEDAFHFKPVRIESRLPTAAGQPWPMGDAANKAPKPTGFDAARLKKALDAAFAPAEAMTAAFLVTKKGQIIAERYGEGISKETPLESWSMGKSVIATLMGVLIEQGAYDLWQPAPIPEWSAPDDPRRAIRIADLLRMSSGLRIKAPNDPDFDPKGTYPDHIYLYTGPENLFHYAATRPLQWPANTVGRYRNTDPVLVSYLIRLAVERRKEEYLAFPRRALLDPLGMRTMMLETDAYGNFLTHGYDLASARDWARLGNLYLQDGLWLGKRVLPEGFSKFVSTPAPAWERDGRPEYGGFFWTNRMGRFPALPEDAYFMAGAGTQMTIIVPSLDLVIVRLGHFKGAQEGFKSLNEALGILMEAMRSQA